VVTEAGLHFRLIDSCITQLKAQGLSRTCNESKEEEEKVPSVVACHCFSLEFAADLSSHGIITRQPQGFLTDHETGFMVGVECVPCNSLEGGGQKSIPPQCSGFQKCRSPLKALLNEFTPPDTLAWYDLAVGVVANAAAGVLEGAARVPVHVRVTG